MPFLLSRVLARLAVLTYWATPVVLVVFVFVTSWPLMALAEPDGSELVQPANYWWWFVVTAATVGYGDFFPRTGWGHVVGGYVIAGGIAALTTVFTKLAARLERAKGRRMQGAISVTATGHTVLLGYAAGRTERIIAQLRAERAGHLVLCAWEEVASHPAPELAIDFVRGDLTEERTIRRAGVAGAAAVLVDGRDDNEALAITVAVHHVNPRVHVVVALRDLDRTSLLHRIDENIRCVQWHTPRMLVEELTSPGIAEVYAELMTEGGVNTYLAQLPASLGPVRIDHCQTALGRAHGATVLAARSDGQLLVNPPWGTELPAGATLYYVSAHRLTPDQISQALRSA